MESPQIQATAKLGSVREACHRACITAGFSCLFFGGRLIRALMTSECVFVNLLRSVRMGLYRVHGEIKRRLKSCNNRCLYVEYQLKGDSGVYSCKV